MRQRNINQQNKIRQRIKYYMEYMFHFKLCFDNNTLRLAMKYSVDLTIYSIQKVSFECTYV